MVCAIKMRFKEKIINILNVEKTVKTRKIYSAITRDLIHLAKKWLKSENLKPVYDVVLTFPTKFADNVSFYFIQVIYCWIK